MDERVYFSPGYQRGIKNRMTRNACVGRAQRIAQEAPMVLRLIQEVIVPQARRQHEADQRRRQSAVERRGGTFLPEGASHVDAGAAQSPPVHYPEGEEGWHMFAGDLGTGRIDVEFASSFERGVHASVFGAHDIEADPVRVGEEVAFLSWDLVERHTFPEQLAIRHLKSGKGLSQKQADWVEKMVLEAPDKERKAQERREARAAQEARSEYVGEVGERLRGIQGRVVMTKRLDGDQWGPKCLVKILQGDNILVTFSTASWAFGVERGDEVTIDGTVKSQQEYQGAKQTTLTRTKRVD